MLLLAVAAFLLTSVGRLHQLFPVLLPFKPLLVAGVLAIIFYFLDSSKARRLEQLRSPTTTCVLALLVWVAVCIPTALWPGGSFQVLADDFIKTVLMYLVIVGSVRGLRDVERLTWAYFLAAVIYAALVVKHSGGWGAYVYYDQNDFATYAVSAMPFGVYFALGKRPSHVRVFAAAGLATLVIAFIRTGSRGGFLALLAMGAFFLLRYTAIRAGWRIAATVLVGLLIAATATETYWTRINTILKAEEDYNRTEEGGRWKIWQRGIRYMLQRPVFGVGAGNFGAAEGTLSPFAKRQQYGIGVKWSAAHNSFVQIGAELGVPGLLLFLGVIISVFRQLTAVERGTAHQDRERSPPQLAQTLKASLVGLLVGGFFLSLAYQAIVYTLAAMAVGLYKATFAAPGPYVPTLVPARRLR